MKTAALVALFVAGAFAQTNLTINTPSEVTECEPTLLTWANGVPPYYVSILPGGDPSGTPLESLPQTNSTSYTWVCDIEANTSIGFTLRDGTGVIAQSASVTVQAGSSSCLGSGSGSSASGSSPSTAASGSTASVSPASSGTSTGSSPSSTASSTSSNGASANIAQFGVAGVVGAIVYACFL